MRTSMYGATFLLVAFAGPAWTDVTIENAMYAVTVDGAHGSIVSLIVKDLGCDMIGEKRLAANFRIGLPLQDYACHYIDGMAQSAPVITSNANSVTVRFSGLASDKGTFPLDLEYIVALDGDAIRFKAKLTNNDSRPVSEFWFPRLGGWTDFGTEKRALLATPNYIGCAHGASLFNGFPGGRGLGAETAEFAANYPGMVMPWWDLYDAQTDYGLYMGYHDTTCRLSTWHTYLFPNASGRPDRAWMTPEEAGGAPIGLVFSHVRYPYIQSGETLDSGEFVMRMHRGDWHSGVKTYREWFMAHFPFDKSNSWLRKQSAWFTSILYQPEDRVVADYKTYDRWCADAQACGIGCYELIGWDRGGIERDYPDYVPEEKLGGRDGFRALLQSINGRGGKCLVFANLNVMDCNTDWYKRELHAFTHQDTFGNTPNWMGWGESTLTARLQLSVRRHVLASIVPGFEKILEDRFVEIVRDGASGLQLDKICAGSALDFNPLNTLKPDVALCEGLVQSVARLREKCRSVNPDFCIASEAGQDRLIPYVDVFYRNASGSDIAPLRYVFPEWTACQHVAAPRDFNGVNGAVATGAVICAEPDSYQNTLADPQYQALGAYIREVERIRKELADTIFLGAYLDTTGGMIKEVTENVATGGPKFQPAASTALTYRVHANKAGQRAIVVANSWTNERRYFWQFFDGSVTEAEIHEPFEATKSVSNDAPITIKGQSVQILIEKPKPFADDVCLYVRCGIPPDEVAFAKPGFGYRVKQGFNSAWGPFWLPPVYHCRADNNEIDIELSVPENTKGMLRLYAIDPDGCGGGRKQEVLVSGQSLGVTESFREGRWLEVPCTEEQTRDGKVNIQIRNQVPGGNAVISLIEWRSN